MTITWNSVTNVYCIDLYYVYPLYQNYAFIPFNANVFIVPCEFLQNADVSNMQLLSSGEGLKYQQIF